MAMDEIHVIHTYVNMCQGEFQNVFIRSLLFFANTRYSFFDRLYDSVRSSAEDNMDCAVAFNIRL